MRVVLILLVFAGGTSACSQLDPYSRTGMWQPEGTNSVNLAVMAAYPRDLLRGHGDPGPQPVLATAAARRLLAGVPKPLPVLSADAAPGSGAAAAPAAAAPAAAN